METSKIINTETDRCVTLTNDMTVLRQRGWPWQQDCKSNHSFIHSVLSLTTDPSSLPKPVLHTVRCSTFCFNLQYPLVSLTLSSSFLRLLPRLPVTSNLPSARSLITCFRRQFLRKTWPIQLSFLILIVYRIFLSPWLNVILLYLSHERSNWSSLSFSNTTFQNFPGISDLLSEVSKFQHHPPNAVL